MTLHPDLKEFIESLNKNKVEYLIVGGYAVIFHGYVRYTGDIDFWVGTSEGNAQKLIKALKDFGFSISNLDSSDFQKEDVVVQLGRPPLRIDILTSVTGLSFEECLNKAQSIEVDDIKINFLDIESLKKNKLISGRQKDLDDFDNLT